MILPTKDRRDFIRTAVRSVRAQTFEDWELIVYDVGLEVTVSDLLPDDQRIRYVRGAAAGPAADFQAALECASGEIVTPLADDDQLPSHALSMVDKRIGEADWLCGRTVLVHNEEPVAFRGGTYGSVEDTRRGHYMLGGAIYWRKELTDRLGGFNPEFEGAADFDLYLRFLEESDPVLVADTLYIHTVHGEQDSLVNQERQAEASRKISGRT